MQLTKIKLSGFKSFVDPTTVLLPSNLVAVVGPNGCGKSNIIDAICWVMGESSAKQLRGELLTDVIFNGSSSRKPVGQASVDLVFDNSDGSIGGEYSQYAEIAIRRQINRNADSGYFLNGVRCRRKDIIDIFLGTGLGPRSYSIIGQNMISRLIEAKPDEMRVYLEEAAGISKYKERRRETENRIQHTKDNLSRLNDVRTELEKQLASLQRQANAAERYKTLKEEERTLKGQAFALQWRQLDSRLVQYALQIQQQETGSEARHAELSSIDLLLETQREEQRDASEAFHEVQRRYYAAGNDITRMEQDIRHHQERQQQWQHDLNQVDGDWQVAVEQLQELQDQLTELSNDISVLGPEADNADVAVTSAVKRLAETEEALQIWQMNWDEFNAFNAKATGIAQVEQTQIQHLEQKIQAAAQRQEKLSQEQQSINFGDLENTLTQLTEQTEQHAALSEEYAEQLEQLRDELAACKDQQHATHSQLDRTRNELQKMQGQQVSLEALQQTALGQRNNTQVEWLSKHDLTEQSRLAQHVEVTAGWEKAVEKVLGNYLQAICVDQIASVAEWVDDFNSGTLCLFSGKTASVSNMTKGISLLSKIQSPLHLDALLAGVYVADTLAEALELCKKLGPDESVITADGVWLNPAWLQLSKDENPAAGVFQREQELKILAQQIETHAALQEDLEQSLADTREQMSELENKRETLQRTANGAQAQLAESQARAKMKREQFAELQAREARLADDLAESVAQITQDQAALATARENWRAALDSLEQQVDKREQLTVQRDQLHENIRQARSTVSMTKDAASALQIRLQTSKTQQASTQQTANHLEQQLTQFAKRKTHLETELAAAVSVSELESELGIALERRLDIEEALNQARTKHDDFQQAIKDLELKRQAVEREMTKIRDMLETLRLETQSLKVKSENVLEQMSAMNLELETILKELTDDLVLEELQARLEQVGSRISRLGAINLVAIEEYATCSERKAYLDSQYNDLQSGLNTLEEAIAKIDKETRTRFKETFDKVNERFQELFPGIFGGGRAYLELTGDNLLDSGITIMACPPGKRNSTIHLLSGGEKALTAIALVFSIFHLNPAPFCLLDEVDAPLDDANIGRFCNLVKKMSEKTQFIFISHNKLAIEMAKHLMGVTMHEPGVSRMVSVNVEEAITLAST